ncbi:MAG TPA: hypothetical protein VNW46_02400 [Gemmatimonadaceae bacterium]|nr:hypothetical protein [Gemmatimonadaceae bacterium]
MSASGLVTGLIATAQTSVLATVSIGGVTHADTVLLQVTAAAPPPVLTTFHLLPPGDSVARLSLDRFGVTLVLQALDATGAPIPNPLVHFTSSDPTIAAIDPIAGIIQPVTPGNVTFYATTTMYGVSKSDSLPFTIGEPTAVLVDVRAYTPTASRAPVSYFEPGTIVIGVGGAVVWTNISGQNADVAFDDSTDVQAAAVLFYGFFPIPATGAGNIPPFPSGVGIASRPSTRARSFPKPGTYSYHSRLYNTTGTIIVKPTS